MSGIASVQEVAAAAQRGETVIDVRTSPEYAGGHITRSAFMPLATVPLRLSELDRHAPVYVVCESGARAFQACQFLDQHGYQAINVHGGMTAWRAQGLPVEAGMLDRVGS
ncbi:MAG: rhodanese-like domain-containing protein [Actinobacteria bacterium]|jgi:rhodanese-related sulfurtransferase|nr:rhodanese-like domain-containing protein [Actinomycetota bacterium]